MTTRYILPLLMLMIFICSCENEINFNKAARPPKLIMNALINADSTNNILYLNKTGQYVISDVTNASVEVRVNDVLVETPKAIPIPTGDFVSLQKRFLITTKFHPGDKVRIDARTEDGEFHAWAEVVVPTNTYRKSRYRYCSCLRIWQLLQPVASLPHHLLRPSGRKELLSSRSGTSLHTVCNHVQTGYNKWQSGTKRYSTYTTKLPNAPS
mgnify:CR=1 FL=1